MSFVLGLLAALRRLFVGPPLTGLRIVVPLPSGIAGPDACLELGLQGGWPAVRAVWPSALPVRVDPDADLGPHDFFATY